MIQPDPTIEDYLEAVNGAHRDLRAREDAVRRLLAERASLTSQLEALNTAIDKALEDEQIFTTLYENRLRDLRDAITSDDL